jgi:hypothetical protein
MIGVGAGDQDSGLRLAELVAAFSLQGTVPLWAWIGDEAATTFSY